MIISCAGMNKINNELRRTENKPQINADERRFVNLNIQRLNGLSLGERDDV